VLGLFNIQTH
jgi:hypothetical protein